MARAWSRTSGACNGSGFSRAGWSFDEGKAGCRTSLAAPTPLAWDEHPSCTVRATKQVRQPAIPVTIIRHTSVPRTRGLAYPLLQLSLLTVVLASSGISIKTETSSLQLG